MYAARFALVGILMLGLMFVARAGDKDKDKGDKKGDSIKDKLVGTWEAQKGKGLPPGTRIQFTKDGKVTITGKKDEKEIKIQGTYKLDGKKLSLTTKQNDEERTRDITINKVSDDQLVLEGGPKKETITLKRVGKTKTKEKEKKKDE